MNDHTILPQTVQEFLRYIQFQKRLSPNTYTSYRNDLDQFNKFRIRNFPETDIESLSHKSIRPWIAEMMSSGIDPTTINRKIHALKSFYGYLLRTETVQNNPANRIKALKRKKRLPQFLTEKEIADVLNRAWDDSIQSWRERLILEMLYCTGIRSAELRNLKECDVDILGQSIKVLGKGDKHRIIPFPTALKGIIEGYTKVRNKCIVLKQHGLLLVNDRGDALNAMSLYRVVQKHLKGRGCKLSPHTLRHTYATHLLDRGAPISAVKDLLGHTSLIATQVYTHTSTDKMKGQFRIAHPRA